MPETPSRRTVLGGFGALFAGAALGELTAGAAGAAPPGRTSAGAAGAAPVPDPLEPVRYGTASTTGALICAAVADGAMWVGSRFGDPTGRIGEFDLATGNLLRSVAFGEGTGTYKMAAGDGVLYVGLTNSPYVWEYRRDTGALRVINPDHPIGPATTWVYDLVVGPDGHVFCGTYPRGEAWEIDPATGEARNWGAFSTAQYCTAVAVDDDWLWLGTTVPGRLMALRRDGTEQRDLTASLPKPGASIWDIALRDGVAYVATDRYLARVSLDGESTWFDLPAKDRLVDGIRVTPSGEVIASARNSCTMYRVEADGLVDLGSPVAADENRLVDRLPDGTLVGVAGSGLIWKLDAAGTVTRYDVAAAGFAMPEKVQSMTTDRRDRVWVGGHFSMTVHTLGAGAPTSRRLHLAGEPKAVTTGPGNTVYAALYPSTEVVAISPELDVTRVGFLHHGQYRPTAAGYDVAAEQVVFTSGGVAGSNQGAVTFLDTGSGDLEVRTDILVGMRASDLWIDGRTLYVVGDTVGEQNPPPDREWAEIAAVDLDTRRVLWRHETVGHKRLSAVCVADGLIHVLASGRPAPWFALDTTTRTEVVAGTVSGQGDLCPITGGPVYALTHFSNAVTRLPSRPGEPQQAVYEGIANGWFNNPMAVPDRRGTGTWGMAGLDLAWFPIPD